MGVWRNAGEQTFDLRVQGIRNKVVIAKFTFHSYTLYLYSLFLIPYSLSLIPFPPSF
jgi:hypothetical protein